MNVPLLDLKAQYATIRDEVMDSVACVLQSQVCIGGPKGAELEARVAAISDSRHAVGVSSGTDALLNAMMSLELGPDDEVITTPFTFFATAGSIHRAGAKIVFADINPGTFNIDAAKIEAAITSKTKAVVPVHLFGQVCDMDSILDLARRYNLFVIEDAAQSITATYKGRKCGGLGDIGCFSFYPTKNLGAAGDGGMLVTNDARLHDRMALMRNHGAEQKYLHRFVGANFRLDPLQAAILLVKLPHLDAWSAARRRNAAYYDQRFRGTTVRAPYVRPDCVSIYNQYVIRVDRRDKLAAHLQRAGIGTEVYYPLPLHLQECFQYLGYRPGDFPEAERAAREVLALPIYPELTTEMLEYVANSVLAFYA